MKKWIITVNLLFYITLLAQWKAVESAQPPSSGNGPPKGGSSTQSQSSTPKSQPQTQANQSQSQSNPPKATSASPTQGTQPSQATSNQSNSQPARNASQSQSSASATNETSSVTGQSSGTPVSSGSTKQVSLDISNTQSTNEFDYKKEDKIHTYSGKSGHSFIKVTQGATVIWECKDDIPGTLVKRKKDELLVILLKNRDFVLFKRDNKAWTDITSQRHNVFELKFYGVNDTEIKSTDYSVTVFDFSYRFTFKDQNSCKKIKYGDNEIWKSTEDPKTCKHFEIGLVSNKFLVCKNESSQKDLNFKGPIIPRKAQPTAPSTTPAAQPAKATPAAAVTPTQAQATSPVTATPPAKAAPEHPKAPEATATTPQTQAEDTPPETSVSTTSGTPVTLDIDKTKSTAEFEYDKEDDCHTYTPKDNRVFSKVTKGTTGIWESKDNICGTKVVLIDDEDGKFVAVLLSNNMFSLCHLDNNTWKDITSTKHDVKKLKFLGESDKELSSSDYSGTIADYSYRYTFKDENSCKKIKYGDEVIWNSTEDPKAVKMVELGLISNKFYVLKSESQFKEIELKGTTTSVTPATASTVATASEAKPAEDQSKAVPTMAQTTTPVTTTPTPPVSEPTVTQATATPTQAPATTPSPTARASPSGTPVTLDVDKKQGAPDFDYSKSDNCHTYTVKQGKVFSKVTKGATTVWEQKNNICGVRVIFIVETEGTFVSILLDNFTFVLLKLTDGKWSDITSTKHDINRLKFFGENDKEITKANYKVALVEYSFRFKFDDGVKCLTVKLGEQVVWRHTDDVKFKEITSFDLGLISNAFFVKNKTDFKKLEFKPTPARPATVTTTDSTQSTTTPQTKATPTPAPATTPPVSGQAVTPSAVTPAAATPAVATPSGRAVKLLIYTNSSTDDYDYTVDYRRNIKIFTPKGNVMFNPVTSNTRVIYETKDPQKYVTKVFTEIGSMADYVTVYLFDGQILHFHWSQNNWNAISNKISLSLSKTSSTIFYDFNHDGERRTFTAKPGYLFNSVFLGGCTGGNTFWEGGTDEQCSSKVIVYGVESSIKNFNIFQNNNQVKHFHKVGRDWVSSTGFTLDINKNSNNDLFDYRSTRGFGHFNPKANLSITNIVKKGLKIWSAKDNDYGLKVVLMGSGKDVKHLSILLQSGRYVLLTKSGQNKPWQDITQNKHNFSGVRLFSLDEGTSKYHQLTREDYEPIVFECRYGYEFRNDVRCVMITDKDMLLWSHTDDTEFGYPKGVYLDLRKNSFSVTNLKDQTKDVQMRKMEAVPAISDIVPVSAAVTKAAPVTKVTLDIEKKQSTTQFSYLVDKEYHKYVVKPNHVFEKITQGTVVIFQAKDGVFGTRVGIKIINNVRYLSILCTNNALKLFTHTAGKWTDITKDRYDIGGLSFYGDNDAVLKPITHYGVDIVDYSYELTFKSGVTCRKIMYGDDNLWRSTDDPKFKDITIMGLGLVSNNFFVYKTGSEFKKIEYKGPITPKVTQPRVSPILPPPKPAEPTPVALDIEKTQSTSEYDYKDENGVITYTPKSDFLFSKVSEGQHEIWKSAANVYGKLVRTKESKGINYLVVLLTNRTFTLFQESDKEWTDITSKRHDVKKLKFLGDGDTVLKETDYDVTIVDMSFSHTFKAGVKCDKVMFRQVVVWKSDDDPKFQQITVFSLGLASNCFFIKNPSGEVKKIEHEAKVVATSVGTVPETERPSFVDPSYTLLKPSISEAPDKVKLYSSKSGVSTCEVEKLFDDFDYVLEGLQCEVIAHSGNCVWKYESGKEYPKFMTYKEEDDEIIVNLEKVYYTCFVENNQWKSKITTKDNSAPIKAGPSYPIGKAPEAKAATVEEPAKVVSTPATKAEPTPAPEPKPKEPTPAPVTKSISLDIDKSGSTDQFDFTDDNNVKTFSRKNDCVFDKVSESNTLIWESEGVSGTMVRTKKFPNGDEFLVILLEDDMFKLFQKPAGGKWSDVTADRFDLKKLKFHGESDKELKPSDYNVNLAFLSYEFIFNTGVKCQKVKLGDDVLWKHDEDQKFEDIKAFTLGLTTNKFFVKNQADEVKKIEPKQSTPDKEPDKEPEKAPETKEEVKEPVKSPAPAAAPATTTPDTQPKATTTAELTSTTAATTTTPPSTTTAATTTPTTAVTPTTATPATPTTPVTTGTTKGVTLDIDKTQSTTEIEYSKSNDKYPTYTAKSGCGFNKIVKKTEVVWESKNVLGTIVVTKGNDNVAIFLESGGCLVFNRSSKNKPWNNTTGQKHDISKVKFFDDKDVEIKRANYKVKVLGYSSSFAFIYEFIGVKCRKVKLGEKEIWKQSDHPGYDVTMFQFDPIKNELYVAKNKDSYKKLKLN